MSLKLGTYQNRIRSSPEHPWGAWSKWEKYYSNDFDINRSGMKCPNYRKIQKAGGILPVNYYLRDELLVERKGCSGSISWFSAGTGSYEYAQEEWIDYYDDGFIEPLKWRTSIPGFDEGLINAALNDAAAEASASATMLPVSIIEARSTLVMLKNAVKRLLKFAEFIRELAIRKKESFSALWLEYRLGWMPFYYELIGFIETVNGALKEGDRQSGSGIRSYNKTGDDTYEETLYPFLKRRVQETYSVEYRCRGFALGTVTSSVTARYGLNPVTVVWELITLSWLLDKFISVGSWLASVSNGMSGFELSATGYSLKTRYTQSKYVMNIANLIPGVGGGGGTGNTGVMRLSITRNTFVRHPAAPGGFPAFNNKLSFVSIIDILALIAQFRKWRI